MTMYDARTRLSAHVVEEVRRYMPEAVLATIIPRAIRLAEAPSYGQVISEYDPESRGAAAYVHLADEVLARLGMPASASQPESNLDNIMVAAINGRDALDGGDSIGAW
jgi:chromosome partitioning protein